MNGPRLAGLLMLTLSGCVSWQVEESAPAQLIQTERPRSVRVLLRDSSVLLVADPRIEAGAIAGAIRLMDPGPAPTPLRDLPVTVPLAEVTSVSVARVDTRRTLLIVVPALVAAGTVAIIAAN